MVVTSEQTEQIEEPEEKTEVNKQIQFNESTFLPKLYSNNTPRSDISEISNKTTQADITELESIVSEEIMKENSILDNLKKMIYTKKRDLNQSKSILEFKYNKYKWCHNFWNIGTIILSSSLTLIESCKLVFIEDIDNGSEALHNFLILSPIILATFITCCASITKFKRYQERMEEIYIVIDKCIGVISKLKSKKDEINLIKNIEKQINICHIDNSKCDCEDLKKLVSNFKTDVENITTSFKNDIINEFSTVYQETERYINHNDYHKYLKTINEIEYKKHILRKDKESFYIHYNINNKHIIDDYRINCIKNKVLKGSDKIENCLGCKKRHY